MVRIAGFQPEYLGSNPRWGIFLNWKAIEYHYYSKKYSSAKEEVKKDNRGIKIIKDFLLDMYKKFGDVNKKKDNE